MPAPTTKTKPNQGLEMNAHYDDGGLTVREAPMAGFRGNTREFRFSREEVEWLSSHIEEAMGYWAALDKAKGGRKP